MARQIDYVLEALVRRERAIENLGHGGHGAHREDVGPMWAKLAELGPQIAGAAEPYYVSQPICRIFETVSLAPVEYRLDRADLPGEAGLLLLESHVHMAEHSCVETLLWYAFDEGLALWEIAHGPDGWGHGVGIWAWGAGLTELQDGGETSNSAAVASRHLFMIFSRFVAQRLLSLTKGESHKPAVKRMTAPCPVVLVLLRGHDQKMSSQRETPVDWSCRWLVKGHWRNQWYPASASHKPMWVGPYVKGPEDKALRMPPERIYAVIR